MTEITQNDTINRRVAELEETNEKVESAGKELDSLKDTQKNLSEQIIPELLEARDLTGMKTMDYEVDIKSRHRVNLPKNSPQQAVAYKWLCDNGHEGAFTYKVIVNFNDYEEAIEFAEKTDNAYVERSIHHSTLEALVNEQIELDPDFPIDIFNTFEQKKTKVKRI